MAIRKIIAAQSPVTLTENDFSEALNIPYCLLIASGGGNIVVNLPAIDSIRKSGKVIAICEDANTEITLNSNAADSITENSNITSSVSVNGNKNFVTLEAITYITGNIWLGSTNGGSGGGITSVTFAELTSLVNANYLIAGNFYLITDFKMVTYIQYSGGGVGSEDVYIGSTEPMIVQAVSPVLLSSKISSILFPTDEITWRFNFSDREWDAVAGQSSGIITSRYDTINKLYRDYDWRNIIFYRWETINGSGIYDSITNTGFGFDFYRPFSQNLGYDNFDIKIGSPLSLNTALGVQYWLDNFVILNNANSNNVTIGYGVTTTQNFGLNKIGYFAGQYCKGVIESNTIQVLVLNDCFEISGNICDYVVQNILANGNINNNNVAGIQSNIIDGNINSNVGLNYENNISARVGSTINNNIVKNINANQEFTQITDNKGVVISNNEYCQIDQNNVSRIVNNTTSGATSLMSIYGNTSFNIQGNTTILVGVFGISGNNVNIIRNNLFHEIVNFSNNVGNNFTNNSFESAGSVNFTQNSFSVLENNFFNGQIIYNNFLASIISDNITPTAGLSSTNPSVTIWDATNGNVEQKLSAGVLSYSAL